MDVRKLILKRMQEKGRLKVADLVRETGYSRVYIHRFFRDLVNEGLIALVGKANQAYYVPAEKKQKEIGTALKVRRILRNRNLSEDRVLSEIKEESGIFSGLPGSVASIVDYAFTEMLNNAIEHSRSDRIDVVITRTPKDITFHVADRGIGIFNNIMEKKHLSNPLEAIQDLLKGKETTAPEAHSGEGIFFTSKIADHLSIRSSEKKLVFDNLKNDLYVKDIKPVEGTRVFFVIGINAQKKLRDLFDRYTDESFRFSKTEAKVRLYQKDVEYVSRSQARRILTGLEKFKTIELDFGGVETIGQAFADEIFRVWQTLHGDVEIIPRNANENVLFMINRAKA
jgi:anti-sigma regulatory factor (Ser/Thr protein kinase)